MQQNLDNNQNRLNDLEIAARNRDQANEMQKDTVLMTKSRTRCGLRLENVLKVGAAFLVPFMIGIFTIVTTMQQNLDNKQNRLNDLEIAACNRDQANELQKDVVYAACIKDISELFMKDSHNLSENEQQNRYAFASAKTMTTLEQIDGKRKTYLIKFLYQAGLLDKRKTVVDLSGANLNGTDLGGSLDTPLSLNYITLRYVSLLNASFVNVNLKDADFSGSILNGANFTSANLAKTNFTGCDLIQADFRGAYIY
ncbi:unnamed protein product [Didymodactylos carnosus]|uniref:Pentapeptide repeat-containing protein n=1 Tax=Didymodactylos carnosus TaxID=1234261 RepID=A0A814XLI1_9BILA|nr:unnamed protein product [Didymodactylos carnosus]CAF1291588.1 unnamed protein product [Didymodactylos carnosus]CAF3981195.1 unnamed protein product [Didymodactylos carnosus]CAF4096396.1 unnamed protein product [Didymodactylos carnosus]